MENIIFCYAGKMGKQAENSGFQERNFMRNNVMFGISNFEIANITLLH